MHLAWLRVRKADGHSMFDRTVYLRERSQSSMLFKKGNSLQRGAGKSESNVILFATSE